MRVSTTELDVMGLAKGEVLAESRGMTATERHLDRIPTDIQLWNEDDNVNVGEMFSDEKVNETIPEADDGQIDDEDSVRRAVVCGSLAANERKSIFGGGEKPDRTDSRVECGDKWNGIVAGTLHRRRSERAMSVRLST